MVSQRATVALGLLLLCHEATSLLCGAQPSRRVRRRAAAADMSAASAPGGGGMIDGQRIGPPPDIPSVMLNNRIVYLGTPISAQVSELIIAQLLFLQYESIEKPVQLYINSCGTTTEDGQPVGFETEAFSIYDTMSYCKAPVHTVLVGKAYGLAAMLLAGGVKGKRTGLQTGTVMLHQPRGQQAQGQASDIAIKAREVLENRRVAFELMSKDMGVPVEKLIADTNRCLYLDAQQAVDYGVMDKVTIKEKTPEMEAEKEVLSSLSRGLG